MNYTQQFQTEFDRIWGLIANSKNFILNENEPFFILDLDHKIKILYTLFTAKNEKGEWILKDPNEKFKLTSTRFFFTNEHKDFMHIDISIDFDKFKKEYGLAPYTSFKEIFLANCIPSNDPEQDSLKIANLKLIKW